MLVSSRRVYRQKYTACLSAEKVTVYSAGFSDTRPSRFQPLTAESCSSLHHENKLRPFMDMLRKGRIWGESKKLHRLAIDLAEKFNLYSTYRLDFLPGQSV